MFEVVKNTVAATAFATENHIQVTLNYESKKNPSLKTYSFKVKEQETKMKIVHVYDKNNNFLGYVKVDNVKNVPVNTVIDGVCRAKTSDCKELIIANKFG